MIQLTLSEVLSGSWMCHLTCKSCRVSSGRRVVHDPEYLDVSLGLWGPHYLGFWRSWYVVIQVNEVGADKRNVETLQHDGHTQNILLQLASTIFNLFCRKHRKSLRASTHQSPKTGAKDLAEKLWDTNVHSTFAYFAMPKNAFRKRGRFQNKRSNRSKIWIIQDNYALKTALQSSMAQVGTHTWAAPLLNLACRCMEMLCCLSNRYVSTFWYLLLP